MAVLTHLPPEILHHIFSYVEPEDLARIPLICRLLNNFIKGNNALCRAIYLRLWDEPPTRDLDFEQELHDIVTLKDLCSPKDSGRDHEIRTYLPFVYRTVTRLLSHAVAVPVPTPALSPASTKVTSNTTDSADPSAPKTKTTIPSITIPPSSSEPARQSRAQTFPRSRNAAFLSALFAEPAARLNFLSRSFLYECGRAMGMLDLGDGIHQLHDYPSESGSESDADAVGVRVGGRRGRRAFTRYGWRRPRRPRETYQMSAKLHCLYGHALGFEDSVTPGTTDPEARKRAVWAARRGGGAYSLACSKVYDLREYTAGTRWGPFLDGGEDAESRGVKVDWEKVEAILIVLGTNIRSKGLERFPIFWHFWGKPFAGSWGKSYIPWSRDREQEKEREMREVDVRDPYGVSGSWLRVVSFLDYTDFFAFNFPAADRRPRDVPRPPLDLDQATRLILVRMRATRVEPPGPADHPDHPVTHFTGFSRALDGSWDDSADADIRGTVRVTPEGEVRWTSYSVYQGEERWKSEGVQVGGIRSARGVVGTWFDKDFNAQGPCGPTAFWKISDRETAADKPEVLLEDLFPLIADDMEEELADDDEIDSDDEWALRNLDPFNADWTEFELEDELDGLYYFDDQDVFDVEDLEDELAGLAEEEEEEWDGNPAEGGQP